MALCGIENDRFCCRLDCPTAGTFFCSLCDIPNGDDFLKYYEKPLTIIETKSQHVERLSDLPF